MTQPVSDSQEIEWQFDTQDPAAVERWLGGRLSRANVTIDRPATRAQHDTYLDTDDWRFYRAGYALRLRRVGRACEATLKSLVSASAEMKQRREVTEPLAEGAEGDPKDLLKHAPGDVGQRVRAVTGARDLKPLFDVHTRRRTWPLHIGRVAVGEVALDEVTIPAPGERSPVRLQRVEVEVDARHIDKLRPFVEQLRAVCRLQPAAVSKFEGGLRAHQLAPSAQPGMGAAVIPNRKALQKATVGELAFAVLRRRFSEVLAREPGARLSLDSEAVHEMRVASRRLRSDLRLFEAILPGEARRLREELRWVASVLGEVRDLDVEIEQVRAWLTHATSAERDALAVLEQLLSRQHQQAHSRMCQALDSPQHERFVTGFTNFLARGLSKSQASQQLATEAMPGLIARQWRKARKPGDRLGPDSPPPEYHALRIQCKRLRYAIECVTELYGRPAGRMLQRLANLQDLLGMYQDTQVAMARLRKLALRYQDELSAETLFALGALAERYARQGQDLIAEFPDCYRRLTGTAWQRFKRAMRAQRR